LTRHSLQKLAERLGGELIWYLCSVGYCIPFDIFKKVFFKELNFTLNKSEIDQNHNRNPNNKKIVKIIKNSFIGNSSPLIIEGIEKI